MLGRVFKLSRLLASGYIEFKGACWNSEVKIGVQNLRAPEMGGIINDIKRQISLDEIGNVDEEWDSFRIILLSEQQRCGRSSGKKDEETFIYHVLPVCLALQYYSAKVLFYFKPVCSRYGTGILSIDLYELL